MSTTRQLAAIMFTDIVGYTALMGKDEPKAMELVRKNREIQKPLIEKYNGPLLKERNKARKEKVPSANMDDGVRKKTEIKMFFVQCSLFEHA